MGGRLSGARPPTVHLSKVSCRMTDISLPPEIVDDLRAQAFAAISCWVHRDQEGFDAVVAGEEAILLPIVIGELITALERILSPDEVIRQVDGFLEIWRTRLGSSA